MARKLLLHIGQHKTGTSYIQGMLVNNLQHFREIGVVPAGHYHPVQGHHHLLHRLLKEGKTEEFYAALDGDGDSIFVTSENLTAWLSRNSDDQNLDFAQRLREHFDLRIVLMLRRQDFLKESVFAEVATNWYRGTIEDENHYFYDFDHLLTRLELAFGQNAIGVGIYRDDMRLDLMANFLKIFDVPIDAGSLSPLPPQRVSLNRRKVALLSQVPKSPRGLFQRVRKAVSESSKIVDDGIKYQMSPEARRDFLRRFRDGNRRVAERYRLGEEVTYYLTDDLLHADFWEPVAPINAEERQVVEDALRNSGLGVGQADRIG